MASYYLLVCFVPFLSGCWSHKSESIMLNGYAEGEFRFLSTIETGNISAIKIQKGDMVQKDQILALIENTDSALGLTKAQAAFDLAAITFKRLQMMEAKGVISKSELDAAQTNFDKTQADLKLAQWHLNKDVLKAPEDGYIQNILRYPGEVTNAQSPIIYFLPKNGVKLRFFVSPTLQQSLKLQQNVRIHVKGLAEPLPAKIQFISQKAEFNPPVLYTNTARERLLFLVEAKPDIPLSIKPGQPVEIEIGYKDAR